MKTFSTICLETDVDLSRYCLIFSIHVATEITQLQKRREGLENYKSKRKKIQDVRIPKKAEAKISFCPFPESFQCPKLFNYFTFDFHEDAFLSFSSKLLFLFQFLIESGLR